MAFSSGLFLTNAGRRLLAKAQTGAELKFTRFGIGDGWLNGQLEVERTSLVAERDSLAITRLRVNTDGTATVGAKRAGTAVGGYFFRELGLFAKNPDIAGGEILYAYANAGSGAQAFPATGSAEIVEKTINAILSISNASNISAVVASGIAITMEDLAAAIADITWTTLPGKPVVFPAADHNHNIAYGIRHIPVLLPTTGWIQNAITGLHEQTVAVTDMLAAYVPVADIRPPEEATLEVLEAIEAAWTQIKRIITVDGGIKLQAAEPPEIAVPIILKIWLYDGISGGTDDEPLQGDYNLLENLPSINSVTLIGNKTSSDLGVEAETMSNFDILDIINNH